MAVKTIKTGGLAIDCRTNIYFRSGETLEVGDKPAVGFSGLTQANLDRLVELNLAKEVSGEEDEVVTENTVNAEEEVITEDIDEPEYKSFTKKKDLDNYAKEKYGIELDRRLTLADMVKQLENELAEDEI